jgi:hypothetical protein
MACKEWEPAEARAYNRGYKVGRRWQKAAAVTPESARGEPSQEMRLQLPEGGSVLILWPDVATAESLEMLSEMLAIRAQWQRRYVAHQAALHGPRAPQKPVSEDL